MLSGHLDWLLRIDLDPGAWLYAALIGVYVPIAATRARARLATMKDSPGRAFRKGAARAQVAILVFALVVAWTHRVRTLPPPFHAWQWLLVVPAAALGQTLRWIAWMSMTVDERRALWVRTILPSRAELPEWTALTVLASVTEEIAYRGLLFAILAVATGSVVFASLLCAISFGAAHAPQGLRSQITIGVLSLILHALVIATGSLLPAMAVHAIANMIAGLRRGKPFSESRNPITELIAA